MPDMSSISWGGHRPITAYGITTSAEVAIEFATA
jgi:hypothetical protein